MVDNHVFCNEFDLRGIRFRAVYTGVLGLGLIVVYVYNEFASQDRRFRVVYKV
jgi:hypothetical protein